MLMYDILIYVLEAWTQKQDSRHSSVATNLFSDCAH